MTACHVFRLAGGRQDCPEPATVSCIVGCAGERIRERNYCTLHLREVEAGQVLCNPCGSVHAVQLLKVLP